MLNWLWRKRTADELAVEFEAAANEETFGVIYTTRRNDLAVRIVKLNPKFDLNTVIQLLLLFGPVIVKLLEYLVGKAEKRIAENVTKPV